MAWARPPFQSQFYVEVDGADITGMPVVSQTQTFCVIPGLTNNSTYKIKVRIVTISVGAPGDTWYSPPALFFQNIHQLKTGSNDGHSPAFDVFLDNSRSNVQNPLLFPTFVAGGEVATAPNYQGLLQLCYVARNLKNAAAIHAGFPACAIVFSWAIRLNHDEIGDLSDAKDVRLLCDFVTRLHVDLSTPIPLTIQMRGLRRDKSTAFGVIQYPALTGKAPTETGAKGGFFQFYNLPEAHGGAVNDVNYNTAATGANVNGLYTGKDMWKIPDYAFENSAAIWRETQYLVFSITNAAPVAYDLVRPWDRGFQIGLGGPPGATWNMVKGHKNDYFLEVTREFKGGLDQPQYIRIDGGKKDVDGSITGTAGAPIEIMRHMADDVIRSMLGYKPTYLGTEMKSRLSWLGRWQTQKAMSTQETLDLIARNLHCFFIMGPDDKLISRSLDINDPNVPVVFTFTDSNCLEIGKPDMRKRSEMFQKFRLQYSIEPSRGEKPTEEMLLGFDLATSKALNAGYSLIRETVDGTLVQQDNPQQLTDLCRLSIQINTAGLGPNEFGVAANDDKVYEWHYRPTSPSLASGQPVERDLPGMGSAKMPKMAMQDLARMVVQFYAMDSWYLSITVSLRNLFYNSAITGLKDEAGTPDNRLKLGDVVNLNSYFHTANQPVKFFIADIDLTQAYTGRATLYLFAPIPPGQFGSLIDNVWDAGILPRNEANYLFKGSLYGLLSENGTYADAGIVGSRNETLNRFPDGTYADPDGSGTGKA